MKERISAAVHTCLILLLLLQLPALLAQQPRRMNILFAIADDQSYPHASAYGQKVFQTPVFDSVAAAGVLFTNAFVAAPQCSPSRAAILTGRNIWQLEEAGTHSSLFPKKFTVFTDQLEQSGYHIGYTGKGWEPGNYQIAGWTRNPVGPEYSKRLLQTTPASGISKNDYAANFRDFLDEKKNDQPFFFWFGAWEPHRDYEPGSGLASGLSAKDLVVPPFLPDNGVVRGDLLDYALEVGWFDAQLGKMLQLLKERGELANTMVVITADNGMPFPYAKANLSEYGIHVPLAICGPTVKDKGRVEKNLVSLIDLAPSFLEMAAVPLFPGITGKSIVPLLQHKQSSGLFRTEVLTGRERHSHARPDNLGYPARAIRTQQYLYIENLKPDRWPMGDPPQPLSKDISTVRKAPDGYEDMDPGPTKSWMIESKDLIPELFIRAFAKRKAEELYDISKDPYCLHDLSDDKAYQSQKEKLKEQLRKELRSQGDPRMTGSGDIFDSYPRFGGMRPLPGFRERGKYNPAYMPGGKISNQ
jgi:N-sulfoglucosamine sulfohydrolase